MANFIEEYAGRFQDFFDIGTETGILAVVARMNGARSVRGMDISREAVNTAKENLELNGFKDGIFKVGDIKKIKGERQYDFVTANLITRDLIDAGRNILSFVKAGKYLAVSGISLENLPMLKKHFALLPLRCLKVKKRRKWVAAIFKRTG